MKDHSREILELCVSDKKYIAHELIRSGSEYAVSIYFEGGHSHSISFGQDEQRAIDTYFGIQKALNESEIKVEWDAKVDASECMREPGRFEKRLKEETEKKKFEPDMPELKADEEECIKLSKLFEEGPEKLTAVDFPQILKDEVLKARYSFTKILREELWKVPTKHFSGEFYVDWNDFDSAYQKIIDRVYNLDIDVGKYEKKP